MHTTILSLKLVREVGPDYGVKKISDSKSGYNFFKNQMEFLDREHFMMAMLDSKNCIVGVHTVSIGSLNASIVHPREVFKIALLANSSALVFAHNHPSGDPEPSPEDHAMTTRLKQGGELLGIRVLDHIIVGDNRYCSFSDKGYL